jgi:vacuolar-type H+-ATPase subunit F/Vma7
MQFFCIADKESSLGFKLAGIETLAVSSRSETLEALQVARSTADVGIILVTEKAAAWAKEEIHETITDKPLPLILEIPSRGQAKKRKSAGELLKELAGIGL